MPKYIIAPERCSWSERAAANHEAAYRLECSWLRPATRVAIIDMDTGETKLFIRELDQDGNIKQVLAGGANE